jgi:hypothetical protein
MVRSLIVYGILILTEEGIELKLVYHLKFWVYCAPTSSISGKLLSGHYVDTRCIRCLLSLSAFWFLLEPFGLKSCVVQLKVVFEKQEQLL